MYRYNLQKNNLNYFALNRYFILYTNNVLLKNEFVHVDYVLVEMHIVYAVRTAKVVQ